MTVLKTYFFSQIFFGEANILFEYQLSVEKTRIILNPRFM
jgi:hypothetical protein